MNSKYFFLINAKSLSLGEGDRCIFYAFGEGNLGVSYGRLEETGGYGVKISVVASPSSVGAEVPDEIPEVGLSTMLCFKNVEAIDRFISTLEKLRDVK